MDLLDCPIQPYDWGSTTAIASMQGREPTGEPEAELWIGAHPVAPSRLWRHDTLVGLDEVIAADPVAELGAAAARWDDRLPFLLKILAAAKPLSLQAHPSLERARRGFADEEAAGVPLTAPERLFRDPNHKPELICALTPFTALCGFRSVGRSVELLTALDAGEVGADLVGRLQAHPDAGGLRDCMVTALGLSATDVEPSLVALGAAARTGVPGFATECAWLARLVDQRRSDPAVFVAALLDLVVLEPGEALFLAAGNLHSYLDGVGVEVMANSDNVLRGGLTSKHIDIDALAEVVITQPGAAPVQRPRAAVWTYDSPVDEFALTRNVLRTGTWAPLPPGPAVAVVTHGGVTVVEGDHRFELTAGQAAWFAAGTDGGTVEGDGTMFIATQGPGFSR